MPDDPFERFERSRGGLLIPLLLFVLGAVPTTLAVRAINELGVPPDAREAQPAMNAPAVDPSGSHPQEPTNRDQSK